MKISIADSRSDAKSLARLFQNSISAAYISHSELQGPRAVRADEWVANVKDVFFHEISERLKEPRQSFPSGQNWKGIIEVHDGDALVGLAFVTLSHDAAVPYGIIEDIVVDKSRRSGGLGEQIMRWIFAQMEAAGIRRQFLESGIGNESAHHLFERLGFKTVSVVMMRDG
ncbi:MAG: GNAT family N-acetyltransferase [Pseudorhodoplanes sp.]|nr:hypothetical protein [Pseudorhodoplanes sp.]MBW7948515.1 GNAT family N-acetyltransferase [Pseudorhodoplanes sp.]MCL4711219.1 GNAT family N-acetyltransferase [Pseudorhodoplanes sp.]